MMTAYESEDELEMPAREKILRAVLDLVPEHGADRITHRLVASYADVSPGTVTYHFASMDELMEEAFHLYMDDYRSGLAAAMKERPLQARRDIAGFLTMMIATRPEDADLARIEYAMIGFAQRSPAFLDEVGAWSRLLENEICTSLQALGDDAPQETAKRLLRLCRGAEFDVLARGESVDCDLLEESLLGLMS